MLVIIAAGIFDLPHSQVRTNHSHPFPDVVVKVVSA